jgi:peroxiredoxin Q/BCP
MKRYQSGISEFTESDALVFGISTDELARNQEFAKSLDLGFALLSDQDGTVAREYGVLMEGASMAKRTTFVVGKDGKIAFIAEGREAMDPTAAASACSKLK